MDMYQIHVWFILITVGAAPLLIELVCSVHMSRLHSTTHANVVAQHDHIELHLTSRWKGYSFMVMSLIHGNMQIFGGVRLTLRHQSVTHTIGACTRDHDHHSSQVEQPYPISVLIPTKLRIPPIHLSCRAVTKTCNTLHTF